MTQPETEVHQVNGLIDTPISVFKGGLPNGTLPDLTKQRDFLVTHYSFKQLRGNSDSYQTCRRDPIKTGRRQQRLKILTRIISSKSLSVMFT